MLDIEHMDDRKGKSINPVEGAFKLAASIQPTCLVEHCRYGLRISRTV